MGGGGAGRSGDPVIGTSGDRETKTLPLINTVDTCDTRKLSHLRGAAQQTINPGDESCKSIFFGVERGGVGSGHRVIENQNLTTDEHG